MTVTSLSAALSVVGLLPSPVFDLTRTLHVASNMARASAPSTKNFEIGHVCVTANGIGSALREFDSLLCWSVSAYPKQEFSAMPDTDDPDDAQLEGSTLGCNLF